MPQILIVDDSPSVRESLRMILAPAWNLAAVSLADDVPALLARERAELLILGLSLPLERPLRLLRDVLAADRDVRVLLLAEPVHLGAARRIFNYRIEAILPKPFDVHTLRRRVAEILAGFDRLPTLRDEIERAERQAELPGANGGILLPPRLRAFVGRAAGTTAHIVIEGERGTGKSALAHLVHRDGPWRAAPCLRLDARSLDDGRLAEALGRLAELVPERHAGVTLCLEEVGALSPDMQLALRDLTEGVWPHGAPGRLRRMGLRVLATTSAPLQDLVAASGFREDLRQALSVLLLRLPPLRERTDELEALAAAFADDWARRTSRATARFTPGALERLRGWLWPGNLRELRTVIGRALALTDGNDIGPDLIRLVDDTAMQAPEEVSIPAATQAPMPGPAPAELPVPGPGLDLLVQLLSHEIRNPLLSIKTFTQLIEDKFDDPDFRMHFYRLVRDDVDRIDGLVQAATTFAGFGEPRPVAVDVSAMIDQALKEHEQTYLRKRIVVLRETAEDVPPALADRAQLAFALRCIIGKAADLMPEGSDILFSSRLLSAPSSRETSGQIPSAPPSRETSGAHLPPEGERGATVEWTIRFAHAESSLAGMGSVLTGEGSPGGLPASIEIMLAERILVRRGGALRVESGVGRETVITILLPAASGAPRP